MVSILKNEYKVKKISLENIVKAQDQPRKVFNESSIDSLAESIAENGIIQPIIVRKLEKSYEIIAGERRYRAAKKANIKYVPCIVMDCDDEKAAVLSLLENIQRQNLDPFEEAIAIRNLLKNNSIRQEDVAKKLGKSQSAVANKLRLLQLDADEIEIIRKAGLTERHSRAFIKVKDKKQRLKIINTVIKRGLNVTQTEKFIDDALCEKVKPKKRILIRDVRIFINTLSKAVGLMKTAGIEVQTIHNETEDYIEYNIKIPKVYEIKTKKEGSL